MDVFFHGPLMKKLSSVITCHEGRFESAPQLIMHLVLLIMEQSKEESKRSDFDYYGIISSLLMLGKDLSESILINGSNRSSSSYLAKSFPRKIIAMARLFPAIILTAVFRLGTIALFINHVFVLDEGLLLIPLKLIFMVPPAITILCVRQKYPGIIELSVVECFIGILGEVSGYTNWGRGNSSQSRWIQFGLNLYFCMIYGVYCVWTVFNPPTQNAENFAIAFLLCGWLSFPLYISQVFFINTIPSNHQEVASQQENSYGQGQCEHVNINIFVI